MQRGGKEQTASGRMKDNRIEGPQLALFASEMLCDFPRIPITGRCMLRASTSRVGKC